MAQTTVIDQQRRVSTNQVMKGFLLLAGFIILRALITNLTGANSEAQTTGQRFLFLGSSFLLLSVGLTYFGFTRWVGIDLKKWWKFDKKRLPGDIAWGMVGFVLSVMANLGVVLAASQLGLIPPEVLAAQPVQLTPLDWVLNLFFGFAIAAFQEETIFRGFLVDALQHRVATFWSVILQAFVFSLAHIGYYPLERWIFFVLAFVLGLIYGILRVKRHSLVAAWIAHGLNG